MTLGELTYVNKRMNQVHYWSDPADIQISIRIIREIWNRIRNQILAWRSLRSLSALVIDVSKIHAVYIHVLWQTADSYGSTIGQFQSKLKAVLFRSAYET